MSYHDVAEFSMLKDELHSQLIATAAHFAEDHGLEPLQPERLNQLSVKLDVIAGKILMYGIDAWPEEARVEEDVPVKV